MTEKGAWVKGGSLHDGFGSFDFWRFLESTLVLLVLQNTVPRDDRDGFDSFGGLGGWRFRL